MIEDMEDKGVLDKARMEGMNQGIWLAVQGLAHDGRWTQAAMEVTEAMRQIFPDDPARGDFALFGYGIEKIKD